MSSLDVADAPGPSDPQGDAAAAGPHASGPIEHLQEAVAVARLDAVAMARVSASGGAIAYGFVILVVGILAGLAPALLVSRTLPGGEGASLVSRLLVVALALPLQVVVSLVYVGVLHLASRILFGGRGTYVGLLRVLWMGAIVQWLQIVPVLGSLVAGIWYLLVSLIAFEEIEGVERLQALVLVVGASALSFLLSMLMGS